MFMPRRGRSNTMARRYKGRPDTFRTDLVHSHALRSLKIQFAISQRKNIGFERTKADSKEYKYYFITKLVRMLEKKLL